MESIYFIHAFIILFLRVNVCSTQECIYTFHDCQDVQNLGHTKSGVYNVTPGGTSDGFSVYCDMDTDKGGWLVFQRRFDGSVNFYRDWNDYEIGFGDVNGEYWLGNIFLHLLVSQKDYRYQLRIDLFDWENNTAYAKYKRFEIVDYRNDYRIYFGGYSGDAGDSLQYHNGIRFSTKDKGVVSCAKGLSGAWWFRECFKSHLNGEYKYGGAQVRKKSNKNRGVQWITWRDNYYSLKKAEMKIKRL